MVAAKSNHGQWEETLELLLEMQRSEIDNDQFSLSRALTASSKLAILEVGEHQHCLAIKLDLEKSQVLATVAMDMYGKCGELRDVLKLLPGPKERPRTSWNVLISAFARHGNFEEAIQAFEEMIAHTAKPDHVTFVSLLSACSHGGLVEEGLAYFFSMETEFGVPVAMEHCVCIVDLLGRLGRFDEVESFIKEMPVPPGAFVWRSLLASCKIHGKWDLEKKLLKTF